MYNRKNIPKRKRSKQKGMIMSRKIIGMILAGIVSVLLVTGCSSQSEDQNVSSTDTTQEAAQEAAEMTDNSSAASADETQADQSGRQRLTVGRKEIASIRLAFDFE